MPSLVSPRPQRPASSFLLDERDQSRRSQPYHFQEADDGFPIRSGSRQNRRAEGSFSRSSYRSTSHAPPVASSSTLEPVHQNESWPRRSRSRQSLRPQHRPVSPVGSDTSTTSTVYTSRNAGRPSIDSVLATSSAAPSKPAQAKYDSALKRWAKWMQKTGKKRWMSSSVVLAAVLVKAAAGLGSFSGMGKPPLYGDYEAQRHWLSLTLHLPISKWYFHNLEYWGLDYPPLTAYHSLALAWLAKVFGDERWIGLRGATEVAEESETKMFMRSTVLLSELLVWVPVVVLAWAGVVLGGGKTRKPKRSVRTKAVAIATMLLQPALILIDNGHFQYNSVMLGLTLLSFCLFHLDRDLSGAAAFVLAMSFKQMAIYYAPAIFAYLLGKCLYQRQEGGVTLFVNIAFISSSTLGLVFAPFLSPSQLPQALHRIFPFARGLFEDKVANVWCAMNVVVKLRDVASIASLTRLALAATVLAVLPSMLGQIWLSWQIAPKEPLTKRTLIPPTLDLLPYTLLVSSMAFFLFSFQVHEKSILLPLLPATMLMAVCEPGSAGSDWEWGVLLNNVGVFSMWPLLKRDGLGVAYASLTLLWNYLIGNDPFALPAGFVKYLSLTVYGSIAALHLLEGVSEPPKHLPDLFVVLNLTLSAAVFSLGFLWALKRQVEESYALIGMSAESTAAASASVSNSRAPSRVASPAMPPVRTMSPAIPVPGRQQATMSDFGDDEGHVRRRRVPSERSRSAAGWEDDRARFFARSDHERPKSRLR